MWGRGAEEESESENGSQDFFDRGQRYASSPERPEAPDQGTDSSQLLYASVAQSHIEKKRYTQNNKSTATTDLDGHPL